MKRFLKTALVLPLATVAWAQIADAPPLNSPQSQVAGTFDPDGAFDNDGLEKDPAGGNPPVDESPNGVDGQPEAFDPDNPDGDTRGGPVNDSCSSAIVIPSNVVTYNPATYSTTTATSQICELAENCESNGAGSSNSVWYVYHPAKAGYITIDTHGSNYDTVLSVWNGCPGGFPPNCTQRTQLACNDNYGFGTTSEITMYVTPRSTGYYIRVADYNSASGGGTLNFNLHYFPPNDLCANATVASGIAYTDVVSTQNALDELCEEPESCELNGVGTSNAVWYKYTPPCNGSISVNTNGSSYDTVLSFWDGCGEWVAVDWPCIHASELACDDDSGTGTNSQILNFTVTEGTEYIIKVSDYNGTQGGGTLVFNLLFSGAGTPSAAITAPAAFGCVCNGNVSVIGSASAGLDLLLGWELDYQPGSGGAWTNISSGISPVSNASLGTWNTTGLNGYYILRLSVVNGCGVANSAVQVVYVDSTFQSLDLRAPANGATAGGFVCIDGTVWDQCFSNYTVQYRALPAGAFAPVDPANPTYGVGVINDPLASWNTAGLADGNYELRVQATDSCGHSASVLRTLTIDNTAPFVEIETPVRCSSVSGLVEVLGTANDVNFAGWTLQYTGGNQHGWVTIASGNHPAVGDVLANWNTAGLENCAYTLRLIAADSSVVSCDDTHSAEYLTSVQIGGQTNGCPEDLDGDGIVALQDLAMLLARFGLRCP